jgi:nitroreductase
LDLFEAIHTQRAMRRLKTDPIPDDALRQILEAAIRAPSGGNRQRWAFLVVRKPETVAKLGDLYRKGFQRLVESDYFSQSHLADDVKLRIGRSAQHLAEHFDAVPVVIVACLYVKGRLDRFTAGASIYPAVQNIMLAARALGIGSTLTTIHRFHKDEVHALLGIPDDYDSAALIPLGYPLGKFGSGTRRPLEEVVFFEEWGQPPDWSAE